MENELVESNLSQNNTSRSDEVFKLDYENLKLENNTHFDNWKNEMLKKYGNDAKLFNCIYDNLYFYVPYNDCKSMPYYLRKCPVCQHKICYFCSRDTEDKYENGNCCMSRKLYYMLFKDSSYFFTDDNKRLSNFYGEIGIFTFPIIYFIYFVGVITASFYYRLYMNHKLFLKYKNDYNKVSTYKSHLKSKGVFYLLTGINVASVICLSFCYIILDTYFKIFMFLISFISKFYPMKWYTGIIFANKI